MYARWSLHALQVCQWLVGGFHQVLRFPPPNWLQWKKRNIVENGDKSNQKQTKVVPNSRLCDGSDIQQFVQWHISCLQSRGVMSGTMSGSFVFTPVYCIPRSCFICFFLIISFWSCYDSLSKCYSCCLIETRRVLLVGQGLFSLSFHMNYHLDCSFFFCVM